MKMMNDIIVWLIVYNATYLKFVSLKYSYIVNLLVYNLLYSVDSVIEKRICDGRKI